MKKLITALAALSVLISCAACGSKEPSSVSDITTESAAATEEADANKEALTEIVSAEQSALAETLSAEEVEELLPGYLWLSGSGGFRFEDGKYYLYMDGSIIGTGTYEIDTSESLIIGHYQASDGNVRINLPYSYENGELKVFNNRGEELMKQIF